MKNLKSWIFLITFLFGLSTAFGQQIFNKYKTFDESKYRWISNNFAPSHPFSLLENKTVSEAVDYFGCEVGDIPCARGSIMSGTGPIEVVLYAPDL